MTEIASDVIFFNANFAIRSIYQSDMIIGLIAGYARNVASFNSNQSAYILCFLLVYQSGNLSINRSSNQQL